MRALKSVLPLAALALLLTPLSALGATSMGTIERFDTAHHSLQLTNGQIYLLPSNDAARGLSSGDRVTITWSMVGNDAVASRIVVRGQDSGNN